MPDDSAFYQAPLFPEEPVETPRERANRLARERRANNPEKYRAKDAEKRNERDPDHHKRYYAANREKLQAKGRERARERSRRDPDYYKRLYAADPERHKGYHRRYREHNPGYWRPWREANREHVNAQARERRAENPEKYRERDRAYYRSPSAQAWREANHESLQDYQREWREENAEQKRQSDKAWREANLDRLRAHYHAWYLDNSDRVKQSAKEWRERNRGTARYKAMQVAKEARRRARKRSNPVEDIPPDYLLQLVEQQKGRCAGCSRKFGKKLPPTLEHVVPLAKGGGTVRDNLEARCRPCNTSKNAKGDADWRREKFGQLL